MPVTFRALGATRWVVVAFLGFLAVGTIGTHRNESPPGPVWLAVLLATCAGLPVLVEVWAPSALLISGALTAAYFAAGYADGPAYLAIPAVTFVVVSTAPRRRWPWIAAAAALGVAGLVVREVLHGGGRPTAWECLGLVALVAVAAAVAAALRSRRIAATERAHSVASEERLRMAADLHDGIGHGLAVIAMQAAAALHVLDEDPTVVRVNLEAIRDASRESLDLLRGQLSRLTGDGPAPRTATPGLADIAALVDRVRSAGLVVGLTLRTGTGLPEAAARVAYAVAQEGLTNVLRHAAATHAEVRVDRVGAALVVSVADDGQGRAPNDQPSAGLGISGMRSRVEELGGTLEAGAAATGFVVRASIPVGVER